ncbi:MAG: ferritin-like domain-containing protein [Candidatus Diapherotrites archaeon]|nr:ferritin-like domain-containing protein [Candidatus Diapherotrites archaeon]
MPMEKVEDLFVHELKDIYYAEKHLEKALQTLATESHRPELKKAFDAHKAEKQEHVKRLERVFDEITVKAAGEPCDGVIGLSMEKKAFSKKNPSKEINDLFNINAAIKAERYEISAYESLSKMAKEMNLMDSSVLLEKNLKEEQRALEKMRQFAREADIKKLI